MRPASPRHAGFVTLAVALAAALAGPLVARAQIPAEAAMPDSSPPERVVIEGRAEVPMVLDRGLPIVEVRVDGRGPFRFGIETGARLIAVTPALAESLDLPRAEGSHDPAACRVDSLSIGAVRLEGLRVTPLETARGGIDGLLGLPAFEDLLLTLDYPGRRVVLERGALPEPDGREVLAIRRVGPFWGVPIEAAGQAFLAIVDTRSTGAFGFTHGDTLRLEHDGPLVVAGVARGAAIPATPVLRGRLAGDVTIGRHVFTRPSFHVRALPPHFPQNPILGSVALQGFSVTLDQRRARLRLARAGEGPIELPAPRPVRVAEPDSARGG
jgi:hypothetical protein